MGLFGPTVVRCPAGQWTEVIATSFAQMPKTFTVSFRTAGGVPLQGAVEVTASAWIFPGSPEARPLSAQMSFERGMWNTFYKVRVFPSVEVEATVS